MIRFNELRITEDRTCLIVDCEVEPIYLYSEKYIEAIYLDYYKYVGATGFPTSKAVLLWENTDSDTSIRAVRTSIKEEDLINAQQEEDVLGSEPFKGGLFFVTVICSGGIHPSAATLPCELDIDRETAVVIDWKSFYEIGMNYIAVLYSGCADKCSIPAGLEEFVLLWNALKTAIAVCDWPMVAKLWDRILRSRYAGGSGRASAGTVCGCGR